MSITSTLVQHFQARLEPTRVKPLMGIHSNDKLPNIRLKLLTLANITAYYYVTRITAVKSEV